MLNFRTEGPWDAAHLAHNARVVNDYVDAEHHRRVFGPSQLTPWGAAKRIPVPPIGEALVLPASTRDEDFATVGFALPSRWDLGDVRIQLYWSKSGFGEGSFLVGVAGGALAEGESLTQPPQVSPQLWLPASGATEVRMFTLSDRIFLDPLDRFLYLRISRFPTTDGVPSDLYLLSVNFHFTPHRREG